MIPEETSLAVVDVIKVLPKYDPYYDSEGYYFDPIRASNAIRWIEGCCTLTSGKQFKGLPLKLRNWQKAIIANVFGWYAHDDGSRRYREILIYIPRKNGKTELMAAILLYIMFCDGEHGAQIYSAASTEKQAHIVFDASKLMIKANQLLLDNCTPYGSAITHELTNSFYKPTVASEKSTHGYNAHAVAVDELHACLESVVEVLSTSQGARFQPLFFYTTTADFDRPSICNKTHKRACEVRDGKMKDAAFLPAIFEADKEDDWTLEETWKKANPNYGVSINVKDFKRDQMKAMADKRAENTFKRLRLNLKVNQSNRWIDLDLWDKCCNKGGDMPSFRGHPSDLAAMAGKVCIAGMDLSSTIDTSSLVLIFPEDGFKIISFFWIPEDTAEEKEKIDKVPYTEWAEDGWIKLTPGNRIDYTFIKQQVIEVFKTTDLKVVGFDPYNAQQTVTELSEDEGVEMQIVVQGYRTLNDACKRFEADMAKGIVDHGDNPILRSHASNVMIMEDPTGSIKVDKAKSSEKVDGMAALVDAYACYISNFEEDDPYNSHGILSLGGDEQADDFSNMWEDEKPEDDGDEDDGDDDYQFLSFE